VNHDKNEKNKAKKIFFHKKRFERFIFATGVQGVVNSYSVRTEFIFFIEKIHSNPYMYNITIDNFVNCKNYKG
tara:strand:- start:117 stop:335 length:219 start_codon:yes stop_codon:yes gene_type:complete